MGASAGGRGRIQGLNPGGARGRRLGVALRRAVRSNEQLGLRGGNRRSQIRAAARRLQG